jgi:hypothetical protein
MAEAETVTLHSRFNRVMALAVWALAAVLAVSTLAAADATLVWVYPSAALLAFLAWAALWRPYVRVDDAGVTLRNVTHRVDVPWEALIHIDTRYALTLHTVGGKFAAWSAPAPGALAASLSARRPGAREARTAGERMRPGDLLGTDSGNAATVVREAWQTRVEAGAIAAGVAHEITVRRRWDVAVMTIAAVLAATALWALAANG